MTNSCIYECTGSHSRNEPAENKFYYKYFMFFLDLDEIDSISQNLKLFSRNKFNLFNFRDKDHIVYERPDVKQNIMKYLRENGISEAVSRIQLLTNVATAGYNFNPVSFYFCYDKNYKPVCVVPEVGNTFQELKPFFIGTDSYSEGEFRATMKKNFYVSPFIEHDIDFDFQLSVPAEKLKIKIDDYKEGKKVFKTSLTGKRMELTDWNLFKNFMKYPFVTLRVIGAIHWQAVKLIFKKVRYFKKNEFLNLQKGAISKWKG